MPAPRLVLASTSPYRARLLERLHVPFEVARPDFDEEEAKGQLSASPEELAPALARGKAASLRAVYPDALIIGGDQIAELAGEALDKPGTPERARAQLARLAGHEHRLLTALCLGLPDGSFLEHLEVHRLQMRALDPAAICRYVDLERPLDCCGSYRIEGLGISLFERIEGEDFTAIEGMPLLALARMLRCTGTELP